MTLTKEELEYITQLINEAARLRKKADELMIESERLRRKVDDSRKVVADLKNQKRGL